MHIFEQQKSKNLCYMKKLNIDKIDLTWEYIKMRQPIRVVSALRVIGPQFLLFFFTLLFPSVEIIYINI